MSFKQNYYKFDKLIAEQREAKRKREEAYRRGRLLRKLQRKEDTEEEEDE